MFPTEGQHRQRPDPHGPSPPQQGQVWPEVHAHPHSDCSLRCHPSLPVFSQWLSEEGRVARGTCGGRNAQRVCLIDEIELLPEKGWGRPRPPPQGLILLSPPTPFTRRWVLGVFQTQGPDPQMQALEESGALGTLDPGIGSGKALSHWGDPCPLFCQLRGPSWVFLLPAPRRGVKVRDTYAGWAPSLPMTLPSPLLTGWRSWTSTATWPSAWQTARTT